MHRIAPSLPSTTRSVRAGRASFRTLGNLTVTLACLAAAGEIHAQTKRCDLVGRDTTITGNPTSFKRCLDLTSLNGTPVAVPVSVTRIDNDGLSLCKGSVQAGGNVDIVYVYDNSGSMTSKLSYVNTATNDTTYYESDVNCTDKSRLAQKTTFTYWNSFGTLQDQVKTVDRLTSNAGCTEYAGDPYQTRARAYYLGIKDQAARAPLSSAGIMSFANSVANRKVSLVLNNTANINTILSGIKAADDGGTAYRPPTDTAKNWLNTGSITSNPKKAIIFLSDGKPKDDVPAWTGPSANMPPIYGIFLGKPRADTAALYSMSQSTGGKFFLIPPDDPDSLKAVVAQILNIVLLEYVPQTATITNSSLTPAQSATSAPADFILQPDGSWLMKMSDIIGLKASASNSISVTTTFKEKTSGALDTKTISFTLNTTLPSSGTSQKIGTTQFGMTCYDKSSLVIQNAAGGRPSYFTAADVAYKTRVRTAPVPLDSASIPARTALLGDAETNVRKPPTITADSMVFIGTSTFTVLTTGSKTNGNGILESNLYDSILVSWVHPRDAQDVATDFMVVRAEKQQAQVWFSQSNGGAATSQYLVDATKVYIVVKDQPADPRRTYTAEVTSNKFGLDKETVTLTEQPGGSGTFVGSLNISNLAKNAGDNLLQVSVGGDQLRVVYKDQVDLDSAVNTAGFDENVQEAPTLEFTDASGNALAPNAIWSPANGKLFLKYSDDYAYGRVPTKQATLTLDNKKYGGSIGIDHEKVTLTMAAGSSGTRATWTGSIDLADAFPSADNNGTAETRFRGEATVTVNGHDNVGAQEPATVSDFLIIAYPDSVASIQWNMDTTVASNEGLLITVNDQTFTLNQKDTALVNVACIGSGDSVAGFAAIEGPTATSGVYSSGTLAKDESAPNLNDKNLSCLTTDQIRIRYTDPVYGTLTELLINEVAKPVADPAGRHFVTSELVSLTTATPGAVIYYTTDGTKPIPGVSAVYADPIRVNVTTTVEAVAVKPGFKNSKIMTQVYTKDFVASRLEILDENGNAIPGGFITGAAKGVQIKLVTTQDNLTSADVPALTKVAGDAETVSLAVSGSLGNAIELLGAVPLNDPAAKSPGNDTLEATGTDTLIVRWVNPFNPADVAADTLVIKPAVVEAQVYFSATENGPKITQYTVGQDSVFIVVKTRPKDPSLTYTVLVSSNAGGTDKETLTLTELSPGVFSAKAPVGITVKAQGDGTIQVAAAGDQLTAVFTDPVYKTDYSGNAGFAQQVQEAARLDFIDETGKVLADADIWSPTKGKVYVRYSDDWNPGITSLIQTKTVHFSLVNRKTGDSVGADVETATLTLKDSTATRGTWEGSITLKDKAPATNGNDTLETYFRGELQATVTPHDNAGQSTAPDVADNLVIAYPDQPAEIVIRDTSGTSVDRKTEKVSIVIHDQIFSNSGQTSINATVTCAQSGDKVSNVTLVWDGSAYVIKPPLDKGEVTGGTVNKNDATLSCRDTDRLTVTYTDPVYGTIRTSDVNWTDGTVAKMYYASTKDGSVITSASDASAKDFQIVVEGKSPTRDQVDTIDVTLVTAQGEKEIYHAIETGPFTSKFVVQADFKFQTADPVQADRIVEAKINPANRINQVLVNGTASISGDNVSADLSLLSSFDLVARAYIKDEDENGRADHAYFVFDHKLPTLPSALDEVFWNQEGSDFKRSADHSMLSFKAGSDSTVIVADFTANQFGANLTDIPSGKPGPYAHFPGDNVFGGQKAGLADSVGPVVVTAVKLPSSLQVYNVTQTEKRFYPDTLVVTVSEKLKTSQDFQNMFRFSKGCVDYSQSKSVSMFNEPAVTVDGLTWTVIVDNSPDAPAPLVKDCIFLEADGRYTDLVKNIPGRLGVELTGENPKQVIRDFRGFPPVAGLDPTQPGFVISTNDVRKDDNSGWSQPTGTGGAYEVVWVPPYGFDPNDPVGSLERVAKDFDNPQSGDRKPEVSYPQPLPLGISTVQVVTSSAYKAQIRIFDNLGHFVRSMTQSYGTNGEDKNTNRTTTRGQASFLVWDMLDDHKDPVGNGVYVWKVAFVFLEKTKRSEIMYTRTGVVRSK